MRAKQLFLIRIALVTGVAAFAALSAFQRARLERAAFDIGAAGQAFPLDLMRYVLWGLAAAAIAATLLLRSRMESAPPAHRGAFLVVGWALGEGVALFGTVQYFIGAAVTTMAVGLLTFVVALMLLPIPTERA